MDHDELAMKIEICAFLKLRPLFVARMLPKPWIKEVVDAGGFVTFAKGSLMPSTSMLSPRISGGASKP